MAMSRDQKVITVVASTVASGGQTYANAVATGKVLNGDFNIVTVANASDAVAIPSNLPVGTVFYVQGGANAGLLFPPTGGTINGGTASASKPLDASVITMVVVTAANVYVANKLAALSA